MPEIENLSAAEIAEILPPDELDLESTQLELAVEHRLAYVDAARARLSHVAELQGAWGRYLDRTPTPQPAPESLSDLVSSARQVLRRNRLTVDRTALLRRSNVLQAFRDELIR